MYDKVMYLGMTIPEWAKAFNYEFSPGELYRMISNGEKLEKLAASRIIDELHNK